MNCNVVSYFAGESPGDSIDVSLRGRLLFAGGSPGNPTDESCWVAFVVPLVQVDTRAVSLTVWLMIQFLICVLRCGTRSLS